MFHLGLFLSLELGMFALVCMLGWIPFLPSVFWDGMERWKWIQSGRRRVEGWFKKRADRKIGTVVDRPSWISNGLAVFFLLYILLWNIKTFDPRFRGVMPSAGLPIGYALRLDQRWQLFSPHPATELGWHVFVGTLRDGSQVDLLQGEGPVSWEKPGNVHSIYKNFRWRQYFRLFLSMPYAAHREQYCRYLCRYWNSTTSENPLVRIDLFYLKTPLSPDKPPPPVEAFLVWEHVCENE